MKSIVTVFCLFCLGSSAVASTKQLSREDVLKLPLVQAGLICADETTSFYAMTALNSLMSEKINNQYVVILDMENKKLGRVNGGKIISYNMTSYASSESAIGVRFIACALVSSQ